MLHQANVDLPSHHCGQWHLTCSHQGGCKLWIRLCSQCETPSGLSLSVTLLHQAVLRHLINNNRVIIFQAESLLCNRHESDVHADNNLLYSDCKQETSAQMKSCTFTNTWELYIGSTLIMIRSKAQVSLQAQRAKHSTLDYCCALWKDAGVIIAPFTASPVCQ